jgi:hypothetical protein
MAAILGVVAAAKGWGLEEAARRTLENFGTFYGWPGGGGGAGGGGAPPTLV